MRRLSTRAVIKNILCKLVQFCHLKRHRTYVHHAAYNFLPLRLMMRLIYFIYYLPLYTM